MARALVVSPRVKKSCHYCGSFFYPDIRTYRAQKACAKKACRLARQREAQQRWLKANPDAFKGRYPKTKRWLAEHPGYLQRYRAEHPEYEAKDNARRAERRLLQKMLAVPAPERGAVPSNDLNKDGADIQDAMTVSGNGNGNENGAAKGVHLKAGTNGNGKENENGIGNDNGGRYTRRDNAEGR